MDESLTFQSTLADLLEKRRNWLDRTQMPRLKEEFRIFQSSFAGLYAVLLKKGVLHEDPYKNDVKIGDLQVPPEGPFSESEKIEQMSIRLSSYESQLDFLVNFYQFSVDFLTMERLKRILALTKYFAWTQLSASSNFINTRTLVEILALVKGGNDPLSTGLVADALQHLDRSSKNIFKYLKDVSDYHREAYKLELRMRFLDAMKFDPATVFSKKDDSLRQIKRKFADGMSDRPFYPELVEEVLKEDYSGEGPALREDLQKRLAVAEEKRQEEKNEVSFKTILMDGLRSLGMLSFTLDDALRKLDENSSLMESAKNGFWDKVRRLLRSMMHREPEDVFYEVEYTDVVTGVSKPEKLNYTDFRAEVTRKSRFLASITAKTANTAKRLEAATDDQVLSVLSKNIEELQSIHKSMSALDIYFKSETPRLERERMRGIKPELSAVKNGIVKANQKRHEYIAQKEEVEQMKRLGIRGDAV